MPAATKSILLPAIPCRKPIHIKRPVLTQARDLEARKLDPLNPFIKAFEERISIFKDKRIAPPAATPSQQSRPLPTQRGTSDRGNEGAMRLSNGGSATARHRV
jgi:hypothetical protein